MAILKIRNENGQVQEILAIRGKKGDSYILTESDKEEIAGMVDAKSTLIVTVNEDGETASHTSGEIYDYVQSGGNVVLLTGENYTTLTRVSPWLCEFGVVTDDYVFFYAAIGEHGVYYSNDVTIPSVAGLATETYVNNAVSGKVDKVTGKGLSTNDYTTTEKNKLSGIEAGAQVNTITGVKGDSESAYRTGNVNITKANIGLGNVDNTADANKTVKHATSADTATKATKDASGNVITSTYATKTELAANRVPACTTSNNGQFLTVVNGVPTWTTIPIAEGVGF